MQTDRADETDDRINTGSNNSSQGKWARFHGSPPNAVRRVRQGVTATVPGDQQRSK